LACDAVVLCSVLCLYCPLGVCFSNENTTCSKKKKKKEEKGMLNKKSKGQVTVVGNNINQAATKTNRFLLSNEKVTRHH
jgi:hypothetical protein